MSIASKIGIIWSLEYLNFTISLNKTYKNVWVQKNDNKTRLKKINCESWKMMWKVKLKKGEKQVEQKWKVEDEIKK